MEKEDAVAEEMAAWVEFSWGCDDFVLRMSQRGYHQHKNPYKEKRSDDVLVEALGGLELVMSRRHAENKFSGRWSQPSWAHQATS